jgi:hypothetical protein
MQQQQQHSPQLQITSTPNRLFKDFQVQRDWFHAVVYGFLQNEGWPIHLGVGLLLAGGVYTLIGYLLREWRRE